jgi:hypothetical protein
LADLKVAKAHNSEIRADHTSHTRFFRKGGE